MSIVFKTIKLKKISKSESSEVEIKYDSDTHEISVVSDFLKGRTYSDSNLFRSFQLLNKDLQGLGYLPLCVMELEKMFHYLAGWRMLPGGGQCYMLTIGIWDIRLCMCLMNVKKILFLNILQALRP